MGIVPCMQAMHQKKKKKKKSDPEQKTVSAKGSCFIQATHQLRKSNTLDNYFEITIVAMGKKDYLAIGLGPRDFCKDGKVANLYW